MKRNRTSQLFRGLSWTVLLSLLIAACGTATTVPMTDAPIVPATDAPAAPSVVPPTETPTELPLSQPLSGLAADPQRVEFQAEDGTNLVGFYYPSKYANAPIVILMHWAGGDLCDWKDIARWMQNRLDENPAKLERCESETRPAPWWDPSWFPPMNADVSLAVFVFDFRGYGESGGGFGNETKQDTLAAFQTAAGFEGVDITRMASLGASIGADGAPDGCLLYNQDAGSGCVGAFSLSPGSYFGMTYSTVVADLAPVPVWCLAGELDGESAPTCKSASGEAYRSEVYPGSNDHGMMLIAPGLDPLPITLIQDFLELVFDIKMK